jgi:hypothetical protein
MSSATSKRRRLSSNASPGAEVLRGKRKRDAVRTPAMLSLPASEWEATNANPGRNAAEDAATSPSSVAALGPGPATTTEPPSRASTVVVGVDVGVRNLSVCRLACRLGGAGAASAEGLPPDAGKCRTTMALALAPHTTIEAWTVDEIVDVKNVSKASSAVLLDGLTGFFDAPRREALFSGTDVIVIETQMTNAKMKTLAAGVFVLARISAPPSARVLFQSAGKKLDYQAEVAFPELAFDTYGHRKKAGGVLCKAFAAEMSLAASCGSPPPSRATARRGKQLSLELCLAEEGPVQLRPSDFLMNHRKRDDLCDSFLHALRYMIDAKSPQPGRKRENPRSAKKETA